MKQAPEDRLPQCPALRDGRVPPPKPPDSKGVALLFQMIMTQAHALRVSYGAVNFCPGTQGPCFRTHVSSSFSSVPVYGKKLEFGCSMFWRSQSMTSGKLLSRRRSLLMGIGALFWVRQNVIALAKAE